MSTSKRAQVPSISEAIEINETGYAIIGGVVTAIVLGGGVLIYSRYLRRIPSADHLQPKDFGRNLRGYVTSVGDADNFRFYHTPGLARLRPVPTDRKDLKDQTLSIRLAGVDAPEGPHFGKPTQPFYNEALAHLTSLVHHKKIVVQPQSRDRYGRIVGIAWVPRLFFPLSVFLPKRNVSTEMLRAGLATVYTAQGAVYGGLLSKFEKEEAKAKAAKRGMWSQSSSSYVSPAEYKRQHSMPE